MTGIFLETIIQVYEVGFYVDENILGVYLRYMRGGYDKYTVESNAYGPYPSRKIAEDEALRLKEEKQKMFENLPPLVLKFVSEPSLENHGLRAEFYYNIREERKEVSKEVHNG